MQKKHSNCQTPITTSLSPSDIFSWLPKRPVDSHKGCFGQVVVIGGDQGMAGAARLCAEGALRVGAGLVTVITLSHHIPIILSNRPELMAYPGETPDSELIHHIQSASIIVIGPGLSLSDFARQWFDVVLSLKIPVLFDAGALTQLAHRALKPSTALDWILTPHPGEAARLLKTSSHIIQNNRTESLNRLQDNYPNATIVLKGHETQVAFLQKRYLCPYGNPGMSTPGMGDVLSGMIAGLFAQGLSSWQAATAGVFLHAYAADLVYDIQGERGLLASDLFSMLLKVINQK